MTLWCNLQTLHPHTTGVLTLLIRFILFCHFCCLQLPYFTF